MCRTDFAKPMIKMSEAATNAGSSSKDDDNGGCNLQGIYDKDERFVLTDYIIDMCIRPDFTKGCKK